jgi:hypothetical protein
MRERDPFAIPGVFFALMLLSLLVWASGHGGPPALFVIAAVVFFIAGLFTCIPPSGTPRA